MPAYDEKPSALLAAMERSVKDPVKRRRVKEVATQLAEHGGEEFRATRDSKGGRQ